MSTEHIIPRWRVASSMPPAHRTRLGQLARALSETRYRLRAPDGTYLHACDFTRCTAELAYAWIGFRSNLTAVRRQHPELAAFAAVTVPPERGVRVLSYGRVNNTELAP